MRTSKRGWNAEYPADSTTYPNSPTHAGSGVEEGLARRIARAGGIRYGRIFKALPDTHGFSVDVVRMSDIAGPHHVHPNGEIDLIVPLTEGATFDGHPAGWCVYGPGSAHRPTVAGAARSCLSVARGRYRIHEARGKRGLSERTPTLCMNHQGHLNG